ncbi:MAG: hypothetical protein HC935_08905, partial [Pseudanabaena sp. SU_2_4]|nr:hypothetical protein [Pseudanabaena sp. SU_2_4]
KRAEALIALARQRAPCSQNSTRPTTSQRQSACVWKIPGIGRWTTGVGLGPALGYDPLVIRTLVRVLEPCHRVDGASQVLDVAVGNWSVIASTCITIASASERGLDVSLYGDAALRSGHEAVHTEWIKRWRCREWKKSTLPRAYTIALPRGAIGFKLLSVKTDN